MNRAQDSARVIIPPPLWYLAAFVAGLFVERWLPLGGLPKTPARILGWLLVACWVGLTLPSFRAIWRAGSSVVPIRPTTALVVTGPYRFSRNPMYVGLAALHAGLALLLNQPWALVLLPLALWAVWRFAIDPEERYLERKFGEEYRRYKATVRRWF